MTKKEGLSNHEQITVDPHLDGNQEGVPFSLSPFGPDRMTLNRSIKPKGDGR